MYRITGIDGDPRPKLTILHDDFEITLRLYFYPQMQSWYADFEMGDRGRNGIRLVAGGDLLKETDIPFGLKVEITDGSGLDPFRVSDFDDGRCELYLILPEEAEQQRGRKIALD